MCKTVCCGLLILGSALLMAAGEPQQSSSGSAAPSTPSTTTPPANLVPPTPGPEVMRPTEHGLRFTPAMARGFAGAFLREKRDDLKLSAEQRDQLREVMARRLMDVARRNEEQVQAGLEYMLEVVIRHEGKGPGINASPEEAQEFAKRCAPLAGVMRELLDANGPDAEPILNPEQRAALDEIDQEGRKDLEHFEQTLNRWAQGGYQKGDNPFDRPKPKSDAQKNEKTPAPPRKPEMRQAEAVAENQMSQIGRNDWQTLKVRTERYFKFSDEQKAKADQLLAEYVAKAESVMTPEWKQRLRTNRIQAHLQYMFKGQPTRPFFFHLQRDYEAMIKPVQQLGEDFKQDLLGLITPEQRSAAQAELQQVASTHGLQLEPADETLLGLATTQPGGAQ